MTELPIQIVLAHRKAVAEVASALALVAAMQSNELRKLAQVAESDTSADGSHESAKVSEMAKSRIALSNALACLGPLPTVPYRDV